jgi:hypothetical protein
MDKEGQGPSLSMGHVPLYPWFVSLFIHGLFLSLSMGFVPLYPWFVSLFIHGSCPSLSMVCVPLGTQTMEKEGHKPWIKRDTTHG